MTSPILPTSNSGGGLRRGRTVAAFKAIAKKHEERVHAVMRTLMDDTVVLLRNITPKDTGAAAGDATGKPMPTRHPGYGMNIGNEVGDTGWQVVHGNNPNKIAIVNPMWKPYLEKVNYTHVYQGNFLETAVRDLRERIKTMRER